MVADGSCGMQTLRALKQLGRLVTGGRPNALRETEQLHRSGTSLAGKTIVLDPGHGGQRPRRHRQRPRGGRDRRGPRRPGRGPPRRGRASAPCSPGRPRPARPTPSGRRSPTRSAPTWSSPCTSTAPPRRSPHGVATYHFGTGSGVTSTVGEELASLVQREVTARTDLLDCAVHGKTWELLRLTRMPAVRLELGHVTAPGDAARLADPAFRDTVAEAVLVGGAAALPAARPRPADRGAAHPRRCRCSRCGSRTRPPLRRGSGPRPRRRSRTRTRSASAPRRPRDRLGRRARPRRDRRAARAAPQGRPLAAARRPRRRRRRLARGRRPARGHRGDRRPGPGRRPGARGARRHPAPCGADATTSTCSSSSARRVWRRRWSARSRSTCGGGRSTRCPSSGSTWARWSPPPGRGADGPRRDSDGRSSGSGVIEPSSRSSATSTSSRQRHRGLELEPQPRPPGWGRTVLKPTERRWSAGSTHAGDSHRSSPNASIARTPRRVRSFATPCSSTRPSPPPWKSGSTCPVISSTASGLTGDVGKATDRGTYAGGA